MGSFSVLVVGDDWREQLDSHIDSDTESRMLRLFLGTCADLPLKPGCSGWDIDKAYTVTAVNEGCAGSARLQDIDFDAVRLEAAEAIQWRWDAAHRLAAGEAWLPWTEIRKRHPAPGKTYDLALEQAAKDEWFQQAPLQRIHRARLSEFNQFFEPTVIDCLLQPRDDVIHRALTSTRMVSPQDVIHEGYYISDIADINAWLGGLDGNTLLTNACVKI